LLGFKALGLTGHLQPPHRHVTVCQSNTAVSCALSAPFAVDCSFSVLFGPGCHAHPTNERYAQNYMSRGETREVDEYVMA
jgi:hypothetical protein